MAPSVTYQCLEEEKKWAFILNVPATVSDDLRMIL
jgi:hypothetical protein